VGKMNRRGFLWHGLSDDGVMRLADYVFVVIVALILLVGFGAIAGAAVTAYRLG